MAARGSGESRAISLLNKGLRLMQEGSLNEAEKVFAASYKAWPNPPALNNQAMCRYMAGDHAGALRLLEPLLHAAGPAPFSRALASLCHGEQGNPLGARQYLMEAVRDYDVGLRSPEARAELPDETWLGYTALIKEAAGDLGDHRLVLDLHARWPGREIPMGAFAAGVAAFNLRKFDQAAKYWRHINDPGWVNPMSAYIAVAELAGAGTVPPFALEYDLNPHWDTANEDEETVRKLAAKGSVKVLFLAALFHPSTTQAGPAVDALITSTGSWGVDLAHRLLNGYRVPMSLKMGAARALTDLGVYSQDQPIPIVHEGRRTTIAVRKMELQAESPEAERKVAEAIRLRDSGRKEEAYRLLLSLYDEGVAYPPAMTTLANLMRDRGELEPARSLLESVLTLYPDHPAVLFNPAGVSLQMGDWEGAGEYARRISIKKAEPALQKKVAEFQAHIHERETMESLADPTFLGDAYREEHEEKEIALELKLRPALRGVPVQWLNAAAALHRVEEVRRRPERERRLAEALLHTLRLRRALAAEPPAVRAGLDYLLEQGGWCKLQALTRRCGALGGDGFWWDEVPPKSPIGRLRALGLVFVGRARVDGRRHKVAVVPVELRKVLAQALAAT